LCACSASENREPAQRAAKIQITTIARQKRLSQRMEEKVTKIVVIARLTPPAIALANRMTNMSIKAIALYFSSLVMGV
jgi:hypothetical protein